MKTKNIFHISLMLITLLPGCGRVTNWAKSNFNQGQDINSDLGSIQQQVHTVRIYDQFATCAIFDGLWLSDAVRTAYADIYAQRHGKDRNTFLRRQLEENKHFISFYVLSSYEIPLGTDNALWTVTLHINDHLFTPIETKMVELPQEYRVFFDKRYNRFKVAYMIKFDAQDIEENALITPETEQLQLVFRSIKKEAMLTWNTLNYASQEEYTA